MRVLLLALIGITLMVHAQDAKQKATLCAACHGPNGVSVNSLWPNLAGQKPDYIVKQINAFRDGSRIDPLMSPVSQTLSDEDIQLLAKYFATMKGAP